MATIGDAARRGQSLQEGWRYGVGVETWLTRSLYLDTEVSTARGAVPASGEARTPRRCLGRQRLACARTLVARGLFLDLRNATNYANYEFYTYNYDYPFLTAGVRPRSLIPTTTSHSLQVCTQLFTRGQDARTSSVVMPRSPTARRWRLAPLDQTHISSAELTALVEREAGGELVRHRDRGSQYPSIRYTEHLAEAALERSVGSVGDSYDNALAESVLGLTQTNESPENLGRFTFSRSAARDPPGRRWPQSCVRRDRGAAARRVAPLPAARAPLARVVRPGRPRHPTMPMGGRMQTLTTTEPLTLEQLARLRADSSLDEWSAETRFLLMGVTPETTVDCIPRCATLPGSAPGDDADAGRPIDFLVQVLHFRTGHTQSLVVGRDPAADLYLPDNTVSRRHAVVCWTEGQVLVSDLFSRNGTFIDGRCIKPGEDYLHAVRTGAQLLFGVAECALLDVRQLRELATVALGKRGRTALAL